ncbi:MAG: hypothetical protein ABIH66_02090, partial [bacterium]
AGHGYVCFDVFASCRGFSFTAADDENTAIMGDDFALKDGAAATMDVAIPKPAKIQLLKDGKVFKEAEGKTLSVDLAGPGVYRVEVYIEKKKKTLPWIYSNPIYVR